MSSLSILVILCTLAIGSLITVSAINQRELKAKHIRQKLGQLKMRVDDLEELVINLDQLVETRAIPKIINDEVIDMVSAMLELDTSARYLEATLINARKRAEELSDDGLKRDISRLKESDAQIAKSQHMLNEAGRVLRNQRSQGRITLAELETFISELSWVHLMVNVISYIGQGHKAINRGDFLSAQAFYKKAQQNLIQSPHADPRRHRMIKELGEILNNRRKSISLDLMAEAFYNPEEVSPNINRGTTRQAEHRKQTRTFNPQPTLDTQINL